MRILFLFFLSCSSDQTDPDRDEIEADLKRVNLHIIEIKDFGFSALSNKMFLVRIVGNNKFDAFFRTE